jgi:hypothetical protein
MGERDRGRSLLCPMSAVAVPETRLTRARGAPVMICDSHAMAGAIAMPEMPEPYRAQRTVGITEGRGLDRKRFRVWCVVCGG